MHIQMDKFAKLDCILLNNNVELLIVQNEVEIPLTMKRMTVVGNLESSNTPAALRKHSKLSTRIGKMGATHAITVQPSE